MLCPAPDLPAPGDGGEGCPHNMGADEQGPLRSRAPMVLPAMEARDSARGSPVWGGGLSSLLIQPDVPGAGRGGWVAARRMTSKRSPQPREEPGTWRGQAQGPAGRLLYPPRTNPPTFMRIPTSWVGRTAVELTRPRRGQRTPMAGGGWGDPARRGLW